MRVLTATLLVLAVQWAFVSRASLGCATADLPLAFALYIGLYGTRRRTGGRREAGGRRLPIWTLWSLGMAIDLLGPYPTGLHSLAFLGLGWAGAGIANRFDPDSPLVRVLALVGGTLALRSLQLAALGAEGAMPPLLRAVHFVGTSAVLTAVVGFLAFQAFDRFFHPSELASLKSG